MLSKEIRIKTIKKEVPLSIKVVFIVLDGVGDRPSSLHEYQTPLEAASNPNMNELAKTGLNGIMDTIAPGIRPGSGTGHLALFGYDPTLYNLRRGPFEALGLGLQMGGEDIALRGNFATIDMNRIVRDRRAGRINYETGVSELVDALRTIEIPEVDTEIGYHPNLSHRLVLVIKGPDLSWKISDSDPGIVDMPVRQVEPLDASVKARKTAQIVNRIIEESHKILRDHPINMEREKNGKSSANVVLTRGAGIVKEVTPFSEKYGLSSVCIAGGNLYKGVARYLGMKVIEVPGATGSIHTNLDAKVESAISALKKHDLVFLHIKGTDLAGEDGNFDLKKSFIEKVDTALNPLLKLDNALFILTADHSTPVTIKSHSADPVPLCINGPEIRFDDVKSYDERSAQQGGLHRIRGMDLMNIVMDLINLEHKYE